MASAEKQNAFKAEGFIVLREFLSSADVEQLEKHALLRAPSESLRKQYNQDVDARRFEYSLGSVKDAAEVVTGKRKNTSDDTEKSDKASNNKCFSLEVLTNLVAQLSEKDPLEPAEAFCIVSEPGSVDQAEHTDSVPNGTDFHSQEEWQNSLHYIGILTPLQETKNCGMTAVVAGSHLDPKTDRINEVRLSLGRGDCLVLDGRTVHRGLANQKQDSAEKKPRRMCFFTYTRPGITDGNAAAYGNGMMPAKRSRADGSGSAEGSSESGGGGEDGRGGKDGRGEGGEDEGESEEDDEDYDSEAEQQEIELLRSIMEYKRAKAAAEGV
jgi:ectoine hydroxylase-related dioxygenase (phytanoyl-CoA dioxygenase family)